MDRIRAYYLIRNPAEFEREARAIQRRNAHRNRFGDVRVATWRGVEYRHHVKPRKHRRATLKMKRIRHALRTEITRAMRPDLERVAP